MYNMTWHFERVDYDCVVDSDTLYTERFNCAAIIFFSIGAMLKKIFFSTSTSFTLSQTGISLDLLCTDRTQKLKCF